MSLFLEERNKYLPYMLKASDVFKKTKPKSRMKSPTKKMLLETGWTPTLYQSGEQRKHALNMLEQNPRRIESSPVRIPNPRPSSPVYDHLPAEEPDDEKKKTLYIKLAKNIIVRNDLIKGLLKETYADLAKDSIASVRELTYEIVKEILKYEELDNGETFMWDDEVYICKIYTDTNVLSSNPVILETLMATEKDFVNNPLLLPSYVLECKNTEQLRNPDKSIGLGENGKPVTVSKLYKMHHRIIKYLKEVQEKKKKEEEENRKKRNREIFDNNNTDDILEDSNNSLSDTHFESPDEESYSSPDNINTKNTNSKPTNTTTTTTTATGTNTSHSKKMKSGSASPYTRASTATSQKSKKSKNSIVKKSSRTNSPPHKIESGRSSFLYMSRPTTGVSKYSKDGSSSRGGVDYKSVRCPSPEDPSQWTIHAEQQIDRLAEERVMLRKVDLYYGDPAAVNVYVGINNLNQSPTDHEFIEFKVKYQQLLDGICPEEIDELVTDVIPPPSLIILFGMIYAMKHSVNIISSLNVPSWKVISKIIVPFSNNIIYLRQFKKKQLSETQVKAMGKFYKNMNYMPETLDEINPSVTYLRDAIHLLLNQRQYLPWMTTVLKTDQQLAIKKEPSDYNKPVKPVKPKKVVKKFSPTTSLPAIVYIQPMNTFYPWAKKEKLKPLPGERDRRKTIEKLTESLRSSRKKKSTTTTKKFNETAPAIVQPTYTPLLELNLDEDNNDSVELSPLSPTADEIEEEKRRKEEAKREERRRKLEQKRKEKEEQERLERERIEQERLEQLRIEEEKRELERQKRLEEIRKREEEERLFEEELKRKEEERRKAEEELMFRPQPVKVEWLPMADENENEGEEEEEQNEDNKPSVENSLKYLCYEDEEENESEKEEIVKGVVDDVILAFEVQLEEKQDADLDEYVNGYIDQLITIQKAEELLNATGNTSLSFIDFSTSSLIIEKNSKFTETAETPVIDFTEEEGGGEYDSASYDLSGYAQEYVDGVIPEVIDEMKREEAEKEMDEVDDSKNTEELNYDIEVIEHPDDEEEEVQINYDEVEDPGLELEIENENENENEEMYQQQLEEEEGEEEEKEPLEEIVDEVENENENDDNSNQYMESGNLDETSLDKSYKDQIVGEIINANKENQYNETMATVNESENDDEIESGEGETTEGSCEEETTEGETGSEETGSEEETTEGEGETGSEETGSGEEEEEEVEEEEPLQEIVDDNENEVENENMNDDNNNTLMESGNLDETSLDRDYKDQIVGEIINENKENQYNETMGETIGETLIENDNNGEEEEETEGTGEEETTEGETEVETGDDEEDDDDSDI